MSDPRGRHATGWATLGALALVALLVGFLVGRSTSPSEGRVTPTNPETSESPKIGTDESAVAATASRLARIITGPTGDPDEYLLQMRGVSAPSWVERAEELARNSIEFVEERYGSGGSIEFHPIRYRIRSQSTDSAVVDIWGVVLASGPNLSGIEESWITGTLELQLVESEWKVAGQRSRGGPTPELLRTEETGDVREVLDDFQEYPVEES